MISIEKSKSKTQPFFIRTTGNNHKPTKQSETFKTKQAAWKNIRTNCEQWNSLGIEVFDRTAGQWWYFHKDHKGRWKKDLGGKPKVTTPEFNKA